MEWYVACQAQWILKSDDNSSGMKYFAKLAVCHLPSKWDCDFKLQWMKVFNDDGLGKIQWPAMC